jgi:hypothetical protein
MGHDTKIKSNRLERVKSAVKKVGKGLARGAGYVAGAAVRGAKAVGREFGAGYKRGRQGSGGGSSSSSSSDSSSSSSDSSSSGSSSSESGSSRPGLLGRIGSALKSGLKRVIAKGARAVSRGARNVARKMEGGTQTSQTTKSSSKPKVTQGKGATPTTQSAKPADPWAGSATTPPKTKTKKAAAPKAKATATPKKKKTSKLDDLLASVRNESVQEKVVNPYAVGMAVAMKSTGDKPPLKKSTITKAHKIAKKVETKEEAIREALLAKMIERIEEQSPEVVSNPSVDKNKKMEMQQNKKLASMQKPQLMAKLRQVQSGVPIQASYQPEGEMIDERRKEDKVAGTPRKSRDKAFEIVAKSMGSSRAGVQPRGKKKVPGQKPPRAGEYGGPASPAQKVAKRRAAAQRAQDMMHSRFD